MAARVVFWFLVAVGALAVAFVLLIVFALLLGKIALF
jgi:hypothetical protein